MHLALIALALQLGTATAAAHRPAMQDGRSAADSARDARRAHDAQAAFERSRRTMLPWGWGGDGHCDVRIGRFCWWNDETAPKLPPEPARIEEQRAVLIAGFDSLAARYPGDDWLGGMRVHYRIDGRRYAAADTVARDCRATAWWCAALQGYAAHAIGDGARADSAFTTAFAAMPDEMRCAWRDIAPLLPDEQRDRYERLPCTDRLPVEERYWLLSRPRLAAAANEWRTEYAVRHLLTWLAERSVSPQAMSWGPDAGEMVLRYGWPTAWSRIHVSNSGIPDQSIVGHDPSPSFSFAPDVPLLDSLVPAGDDAWALLAPRSRSRFAPHAVRRIVPVGVQLARFRRGDSTLLVAAYAARDDSIAAPRTSLAAALDDGTTHATPLDSSRVGQAMILLSAPPRLAGVEVVDTAAQTLARSRTVFAAPRDSTALALSDLLLYRAAGAPASTLDSALARAIPGDTAARSHPLGVFWEAYGLLGAGASVDVAVTVERVDHGWLRGVRQRLGLAPPDTPLRMRWSDTRPPTSGMAPRAISLDLANLPAGRYRLTLSLIPSDGVAVASSRELELLDH